MTLATQIDRIEFAVAGETVVGNLHRPAGRGPYPALVTAGPMTSIKEQVTGTYADAMAKHGFAALALDHRHYGESGGTPRQYEYYPHKIEDLRAAIHTLLAHPDVSWVGALSICLGCGYMAHAIGNHPDIAAFGAVAGYYRDVPEMRARDPEGHAERVAQGHAALRKYAATGEVDIVPAAALSGDAAMLLQSTYDYYTDRAAHRNYRNEFAVMSRAAFLDFDVQPAADQLTMSFLMLHGPNALNPIWAERFFERVPARQKSRVELTSKGQTDIYDDPTIVGFAAQQLASFFHNAGAPSGMAA